MGKGLSRASGLSCLLSPVGTSPFQNRLGPVAIQLACGALLSLLDPWDDNPPREEARKSPSPGSPAPSSPGSSRTCSSTSSASCIPLPQYDLNLRLKHLRQLPPRQRID